MSERTIDGAVILDDHRRCMGVVSEVEACLEQPIDRGGRWAAQLVDSLDRLSEALSAHFRMEEQEPLFVTMPSARPRFAQTLVRLKAEHEDMLQELEDVRARAAKLGTERLREQRTVNGQVQMLIAAIRRHEAEENEILIHAYWDETGVGD
jgi:hypothetical protein